MNFDIFDSMGSFIGTIAEKTDGSGEGVFALISFIFRLLLFFTFLVVPVLIWYMYFFDMELLPIFQGQEREIFLATAELSLPITGVIALIFAGITQFKSVHPMVQWILFTWIPCATYLYFSRYLGERVSERIIMAVLVPEFPSFAFTMISRLFAKKNL